ncbi:MAG: hypothetical protein ACKV22_09800 [Bryobacteraceae bacterium]
MTISNEFAIRDLLKNEFEARVKVGKYEHSTVYKTIDSYFKIAKSLCAIVAPDREAGEILMQHDWPDDRHPDKFVLHNFWLVAETYILAVESPDPCKATLVPISEISQVLLGYKGRSPTSDSESAESSLTVKLRLRSAPSGWSLTAKGSRCKALEAQLHLLTRGVVSITTQ